MQSRSAADGIEPLPISVIALDRLATLPFIHKDPFDRIVAATALTTGNKLISADSIYQNARKTPCFSYGDISATSFLRRSLSFSIV
jgi:PIN domain nuclease of toxin-antitoxin system